MKGIHCSQCRRKFPDRATLILHLAEHAMKDRQCPHCCTKLYHSDGKVGSNSYQHHLEKCKRLPGIIKTGLGGNQEMEVQEADCISDESYVSPDTSIEAINQVSESTNIETIGAELAEHVVDPISSNVLPPHNMESNTTLGNEKLHTKNGRKKRKRKIRFGRPRNNNYAVDSYGICRKLPKQHVVLTEDSTVVISGGEIRSQKFYRDKIIEMGTSTKRRKRAAKYRCYNCGENFTSKLKRKVHPCLENLKRMKSCNVVLKKFAISSDFVTLTTGVIKDLNCSACGKAFSEEDAHELHAKTCDVQVNSNSSVSLKDKDKIAADSEICDKIINSQQLSSSHCKLSSSLKKDELDHVATTKGRLITNRKCPSTSKVKQLGSHSLPSSPKKDEPDPVATAKETASPCKDQIANQLCTPAPSVELITIVKTSPKHSSEEDNFHSFNTSYFESSSNQPLVENRTSSLSSSYLPPSNFNNRLSYSETSSNQPRLGSHTSSLISYPPPSNFNNQLQNTRFQSPVGHINSRSQAQNAILNESGMPQFERCSCYRMNAPEWPNVAFSTYPLTAAGNISFQNACPQALPSYLEQQLNTPESMLPGNGSALYAEQLSCPESELPSSQSLSLQLPTASVGYDQLKANNYYPSHTSVYPFLTQYCTSSNNIRGLPLCQNYKDPMQMPYLQSSPYSVKNPNFYGNYQTKFPEYTESLPTVSSDPSNFGVITNVISLASECSGETFEDFRDNIEVVFTEDHKDYDVYAVKDKDIEDNGTVKRYVCPKCAHSFLSVGGIAQHLEKAHKKIVDREMKVRVLLESKAVVS